jgi:hypothetical protein
VLPEGFEDLQRFVAKWDHPGTNGRYTERLASSISELEDFHASFRARLPDVKTHLDARAFDEYSEADGRLARLAFAWIQAAEAVEVFRQPRVPDSKTQWDFQVEPEL